MYPQWNGTRLVLEFMSIFIAVISAFALNNWNENRRDNQAATKILVEISNGLQKDLMDIKTNIGGHQKGIAACKFWRRMILNQEQNSDTTAQYYLALTRDFFSAQNSAGYETLKSKGLELLKNDSLRYDIISLYEYDYKSLKTMEEEYFEMQFQANYFKEFNQLISPYFQFDDRGNLIGMNRPLRLAAADQKLLLSDLWKIQLNRFFILGYYNSMENKIQDITRRIAAEIKR